MPNHLQWYFNLDKKVIFIKSISSIKPVDNLPLTIINTADVAHGIRSFKMPANILNQQIVYSRLFKE